MSKNHDKIISALITTPTITAAADKAGCSERNIRRLMADPDFRKRYDDACTALVTDAAKNLQKCLKGAVGTLIKIAGDADVPPQTRVNAANAIINHSIRLTEITDILPRIEALERIEEENRERY